MASLSKHTWYTTFRRQRVSFCFVLFCPRFWLGGVGAIAREAPSKKHGAPPTLPCQAWRPVKRACGRTTEQGSLGAGGKSLQSSVQRGTELKGRGPDLWEPRQGFARWCHRMILAWIKDSRLRICHAVARSGQSASYRRASAQIHTQ